MAYMEEVYGDGLQRVNGVKALATFQNVLERGEVVGLFQRADWELQFQRGKGRSGGSDSEGTWGRTGRVTDNKYRKVSLLSEKTIDKYLEDYANKEDRGYAQAYVTSISPEDYIWLTTTKQSAEWVKADSRELEAEEFISSKVPITLTVDESGKVIDHDGVHRMQSLYAKYVSRQGCFIFQ